MSDEKGRLCEASFLAVADQPTVLKNQIVHVAGDAASL